MRFDGKWLSKSEQEFRVEVETWMRDLQGIKYRSSTRTEHLAEARRHVEDFGRFNSGEHFTHNEYCKAFYNAYSKVFAGKGPLPKPAFNVQEKQANRNRIMALNVMLAHKLALLEHWERERFTTNDFLQGSPDDVSSVLMFMVDDATRRVGEPQPGPWIDVWKGVKKETSTKWEETALLRTVTGVASIQAGAEIRKEKVVMLAEGIRGKAGFGTFIGAKGRVSGTAAAGRMGDGLGVELSGQVDAMLGLEITAEVELDVYEYISARVAGRAFAGASISASGKLSLNTATGLDLNIEASAFAGFMAEGEASVTGKWKDRKILGATAKASASFGVGASGKIALSTPFFGPSQFTIEGGLTLGPGASIGTVMEIDFSNLRLSGEQFIYEDLMQALIQKEKRYQRLMGDQENMAIHRHAVAAIRTLQNEVDKQSKMLEESRVA